MILGFLDTLSIIMRISLFIAVPLTVVALAGLFSERSGVVNIALEGIMVIGAISGALSTYMLYTNYEIVGFKLFLIGTVFAGVIGLLFSLLHAFASINMKANQIISGTALNIFAPAFGIFLARALFEGAGKFEVKKNQFFIKEINHLSDIPVIGDIFFTKTFPTIYVGIVLFIIAYIVLYKTKFGLRLRACGDHPQAADAAGINVYRMRYAGVMISGLLAGIGGWLYIVPISTNYDPLYSVQGMGFLALAVLISGQWKPMRILIVALLFGLAMNISNMTDQIPFLDNLSFSDDATTNSIVKTPLLRIFPYVATLVVLAFTSRYSQGPRAAGEPYDAGKR